MNLGLFIKQVFFVFVICYYENKKQKKVHKVMR